MMKNTLYLFVAILCFACKQPHPQQPKEDLVFKQEADSLRLSFIEGMTVPFSKDLSDSNQLFFTSSSWFDTAYLFHIRKFGDEEIRGVVYEMPAGARGSTYNLADQRPFHSSSYPFIGYGFNLNISQWNALMTQVNRIINDTAAIRQIREKSQCTDGTSHELIFNGMIISGTNCEDSIFERFTNYMKEQIVYKIHQ